MKEKGGQEKREPLSGRLDQPTTPTHTRTHPSQVEFSYSVDWIEEPQLAWQDRMLRYVDSRFIPSTFEVGPSIMIFLLLESLACVLDGWIIGLNY